MRRLPAPEGRLPLPERRMLGSVMLLEVDSTTLPHLMCDARCPFCGKLMKLVSYFDVVELVAVEGREGKG
jgi:hypothetical protein